jgi:hypothetical protein
MHLRRSNSITHLDLSCRQESGKQEAPLAAAVPRKINAGISTRKDKYGNAAGISSGRFEFVLDESDGTLWLINAEKLVIEQQTLQVEDVNSVEDEQIRYFKEDEFRELMKEQEQKYEVLKQRWEVQERSRYEWGDSESWYAYEPSTSAIIAEAVKNRKSNVQITTDGNTYEIDLNSMTQRHPSGDLSEVRLAPGGGSTSDDDGPQLELVSKTAADRLAGTKSPDELLKFYQAESKMLRYFKALKSEEFDPDHARKAAGDRALGLCMWFRRWVRVHKGRRHCSNAKIAMLMASGTPTANRARMSLEDPSTQTRRVRSAGHHRHAA